jgi:RNA polymerase sigma-70 factor (ECF subfamily)
MEAALEQEWLARAREGDDAAFRAIYEALRGDVFRVCMRLCGERTLAEDAMQNAFFAAFRGLHGFRGDAQLSTWIYRVAIRESLALRSRRPPPAEPPEAAAKLAATGPPVDAQVAARERVHAVQAAVRLLSAEHQAVLSLFAVDGLSHRQIADVLGIAEGTVWYRLHEARKALRLRLRAASRGASPALRAAHRSAGS